MPMIYIIVRQRDVRKDGSTGYLKIDLLFLNKLFAPPLRAHCHLSYNIVIEIT